MDVLRVHTRSENELKTVNHRLVCVYNYASTVWHSDVWANRLLMVLCAISVFVGMWVYAFFMLIYFYRKMSYFSSSRAFSYLQVLVSVSLSLSPARAASAYTWHWASDVFVLFHYESRNVKPHPGTRAKVSRMLKSLGYILWRQFTDFRGKSCKVADPYQSGHKSTDWANFHPYI